MSNEEVSREDYNNLILLTLALMINLRNYENAEDSKNERNNKDDENATI